MTSTNKNKRISSGSSGLTGYPKGPHMIRIEERAKPKVVLHRARKAGSKLWIRLDLGAETYLLEIHEALELANNLADAIEKKEATPATSVPRRTVIPL